MKNTILQLISPIQNHCSFNHQKSKITIIIIIGVKWIVIKLFYALGWSFKISPDHNSELLQCVSISACFNVSPKRRDVGRVRREARGIYDSHQFYWRDVGSVSLA